MTVNKGDVQRLNLDQITLDGTVITATGAEINALAGATASAAELNYLDITTLGTGAASKAVVLNASGDYTFPATATIVMPSSGDMTFASGSTLDVSGTFEIGNVAMTATAAELNYLDLATLGTGAASKAVVLDAGDDYVWPASGILTYGVLKDPAGSTLAATVAEINRAADVSTRIVNATTSTLTVTEADHDGKTIVLDLAAGIAVTLPAAAAGLEFNFIIKTTFTGAASIKSVSGADIMIGHALMGNDTDNTVVDFPSLAASTNDTIDLFGTANSTGGIAGQTITIKGLATNLWHVAIRGDAAGTEATPFANTVA